MTPGYFGHLAQVAGEGEALQHADGLDDVFVDLVALLLGKGAAADGEVVVLPPVVEVGGHPDLEAPGVVAGEVVLVRAGNEVNRLVGEQLLAAGQGGGAWMALSLLLADAEAIVQSAQPATFGDGIQPGQFLRRHPLTSQVALGHEGKLLIQGLPVGC